MRAGDLDVVKPLKVIQSGVRCGQDSALLSHGNYKMASCNNAALELHSFHLIS